MNLTIKIKWRAATAKIDTAELMAKLERDPALTRAGAKVEIVEDRASRYWKTIRRRKFEPHAFVKQTHCGDCLRDYHRRWMADDRAAEMIEALRANTIALKRVGGELT